MKKRKLGYLGRQLLTYSLILLVFSVLTTAAVYSYVRDISAENAAVTHTQAADSAIENLDSYVDQIMLIGTQVAHDSEIVDLFQQLYEADTSLDTNFFAADTDGRKALLDNLNNHNRGKNPAWRISVYNFHGDYLCTDLTDEKLQYGSQYTLDENLHTSLAALMEASDYQPVLRGPAPDPFGSGSWDTTYLILYTPIQSYDGTETYGYVEVFQPIAPLYELLEIDEQAGIDLYLFTDDGNQVYPRDRQLADLSGDDYYITTAASSYDWSVSLAQSRSDMLLPYHSMILYLLASLATLFLLLMLAVSLAARYVNKPILQLSKKVKQATLDSIPEHTTLNHAADEVKELEQSFDLMMQRLKTSVELEKKAYQKALQAQMNPHFLYNSLFTISSMAMELDDRTIPKFCDHLAAILRYETTYNDHQVTLNEEIAYIRDYLELMKLRFEDSFDYTMELDETLLSLPAPQLTLQPIVENCFEHAFAAVSPPWHITLRVFREADRCVVSVADNGSGFDEAKRLQLMQQVEQMTQNLSETYSDLQIGGLGLANTILRLRLAIGDGMTCHIEPNTPTGTIVTLKGPLNHESTDRRG